MDTNSDTEQLTKNEVEDDNNKKSTGNKTEVKKVTSGRKLSAEMQIKLIEKSEDKLSKKLNDLKNKKKEVESNFNNKLYYLIGKAIWEDLTDTKSLDEAEYLKQLDNLKKTLKSKVTSKPDINFLKEAKLME